MNDYAEMIARIERTGYLHEPRTVTPRCPICGAEADTIYLDKYGDVAGCELCIKCVDAYDFLLND